MKKHHMKVLCPELSEHLWCLLTYLSVQFWVPHWAGYLEGSDTSTALQAPSTVSSSRWALHAFWQNKCLRYYYIGSLSQKRATSYQCYCDG